MTVIVSIKITDGIVMAADSAATFGVGQTYLSADKIVNLVKGLPVGVMVTGSGGIGIESFATLMKDLRGALSAGGSEAIDPHSYTIREICDRLCDLLDAKVKATEENVFMHLRVCGYSAGHPGSELWDIIVRDGGCQAPEIAQAEGDFGPRWAGEFEVLDRLILGIGTGFVDAATSTGMQKDEAVTLKSKLLNAGMVEPLVMAAMPIQDAVELARFLVETTIGFVRFSLRRQPKTVGGPIEIAAITKHEGFRWVQRKHFYPASLNS